MIMPMPRRGQNDIPPRHGNFLALDGSEAIVALDDEPQRERDVSVSGGRFPREDELEA
jgi:hypothetical protein